MNKFILGIVIVAIAAALAWFFFAAGQNETDEQAATTQKETPEATESADKSEGDEEKEPTEPESSNTITYTDSGFSPGAITIKSGESVTWVNNSSSTVQIGSDVHPTHNINRELSGNEFVIELAPGESQSVQLNSTGSWGYHNHLNASRVGTINVE